MVRHYLGSRLWGLPVPVAVVSGTVAGAVAIALVGAFLWRRRRRPAKSKDGVPPPAPGLEHEDSVERGVEHGQELGSNLPPSIVIAGGNGTTGRPSTQNSSTPPFAHGTHHQPEVALQPLSQHTGVAGEAELGDCKRPHQSLSMAPPAVVPTAQQSSHKQTAPQLDEDNSIRVCAGEDAEGVPPETEQSVLTATCSTADLSAGRRDDSASVEFHLENDPVPSERGAPSMAGGRKTSDGGVSYGQAVLAAAQELAQHCQIPGVSEAATVVSILARLVSDSRDYAGRGDAGIKRCRSIVMMLERAAQVLGKVSGMVCGRASWSRCFPRSCKIDASFQVVGSLWG